ncbi:hypothetical protein RchiOBHm_Chr5g0062201 [Rosa chinensis]|uniref:Uncharacterized protein n=1 Tax=Rosa chinensis TaxID=74649 RepID=A0A2P6QI46_ROSCH|nr:hypothetical protein RchiOBHm_Chr5g0062201 [Rosa chinensis]
MKEDSCGNNQEAHAAISMENREHNVAGASTLMKEFAINVGPCADNCNKQVCKVGSWYNIIWVLTADIGINDLVKQSAADGSLC